MGCSFIFLKEGEKIQLQFWLSVSNIRTGIYPVSYHIISLENSWGCQILSHPIVMIPVCSHSHRGYINSEDQKDIIYNTNYWSTGLMYLYFRFFCSIYILLLVYITFCILCVLLLSVLFIIKIMFLLNCVTADQAQDINTVCMMKIFYKMN